MTTIKFNERYSGHSLNMIKTEDNIIIVEGIKVRVNKTLENNSVYAFRKNGNKVALEKDSTSWTCPKNTYEQIMKDGNDIINRLFGDIIDKTKDISAK